MPNKENSLGKETIYICQCCENREKEFALADRNYKYCAKCGNISIKSTIADTYNYVPVKRQPEGLE